MATVKEIYRILRHHDDNLKTLALPEQWAETIVAESTTRKAFLVTLVCLRNKASLSTPKNQKALTEAEVRASLPQQILDCTSLYVRAAVAIHVFPQTLAKQLQRDFVLAQLVIRSDTVNDMITTLYSEEPLTEEERAIVANGDSRLKRAKHAEDGNNGHMLKVSPKRVRIINTILREDVVDNINSIKDRVKLGASIYSIVQMLVAMSHLARTSRYAKLAKKLDGAFYLDCVHHHVNLDEKIKLDDEFIAVRRANPDEPYRLLAPYEPLVESYYRATLPESKVSEFMLKAKKDFKRAPISLLCQVLDKCALESGEAPLHCYEIEIKKRKESKSTPATNKTKDLITLNGDGGSVVEVYEGEPNYSDKLVESTQSYNGVIYHVTTIGGVLFNVRGSSSEFGGKRRCITYDNLPWSERLDLVQTTKIKLQRMTKAELARKVHNTNKNKQLSVSEKDADGFYKRFDVKTSGAMNRKRKARLEEDDAAVPDAGATLKQESDEED